MQIPEEEIAKQALALPVEARAELVDRLLKSLDSEQEGLIQEHWAAEGIRRLKELRDGVVKPVPGEEAVARLREKYAK